jgi:putative heme transporter
VVAGALLILLSTFFFLRDGELIWRWVCSLAPAAARQRIDHAGRLGWRALGGYMRGVVLIALFHAVTVTILLFVLHVPLAAALGVVIFLGSFVPLVGITVAGALCVAVTLLEHGVPAAITVTIAIIILFQLEGHLLQPLIMSRAVEIHPLAIAVTVLSASAVAGIPGALIGVPLIAFLNTVVRALRVPLDEEPVGSSVPSEDSQPAPPAGAAERGVPS